MVSLKIIEKNITIHDPEKVADYLSKYGIKYEVRYTIKGHGLFHINAEDEVTLSVEVGKGDLLRIPFLILYSILI